MEDLALRGKKRIYINQNSGNINGFYDLKIKNHTAMAESTVLYCW